jgi:RNA polymerase sigma-B factor
MVSIGFHASRPSTPSSSRLPAAPATGGHLHGTRGAPIRRNDAVPASQREKPELFARAQAGDRTAQQQLTERFLPLARQLARRYQGGDEPLDDLVQVASVGLLKAIDRFDPARGIAFSSYAVPTILGELKRHFRDRTWSMRVPRDLQELSLRIDRTVEQLSRGLHRAPSIGEIAAEVGASEEQVLEALEAGANYRTASLHAPRIGDEADGETLGDALGSDDASYGLAEDRATLERLLRTVSPREREVLRLRFAEDLTQAEIGERIGVSQMQVSRIIRQALTRLRAVAAPDG